MRLINAESEGDLEMLESTNANGIVQGCRVVRDMSSDKALQARALTREKAIRDEVSALSYARREGIQQGEGNLIQKMRRSGMSEEQIQNILSFS